MFKTSIIIIVLITAGLVGAFFIRPLFMDVVDLRAESAKLDEADTNLREVETVVRSLRSTMESISTTERDRLETILPENVDNIRFLNMLAFVAQRNGVVLEALTLSGGTESTSVSETSPLQTVGASFSVVAPYDTFKTFLRDMEQSLVIVDTKSLSVSSESLAEEGGASGSYSFDIELVTYWKE